jgi:hypothetical protein
MAKTLLNAVNEILRRVGMVQGDDALLTSLAVSARQRSIDIAVQVVNEGIDELYSTTNQPQPNAQASSTVTLVSSQRAYTLATDLVRLRWPMIDTTNTQFLYEYPGGYDDLLLLDPEQDDTGLPFYAAIRPTDGKLHLDRTPTSAEDGRIYTYQYDKDVSLTNAEDTVPFGNAVFRAMVPAWVQLWKREQNNEFDGDLFKANIGRASRLMTQAQPRDDYWPR